MKDSQKSTKDATASDTKRIVIRLEHGRDYRNRIGERVTVFKFGGSKYFPFADVLGRSYTDSGKVWKGRESDYDLVEAL